VAATDGATNTFLTQVTQGHCRIRPVDDGNDDEELNNIVWKQVLAEYLYVSNVT